MVETNLVKHKRVYIVADSILSPLGYDTDENFAAIRRYDSAIKLQSGDIAFEDVMASAIDPSFYASLANEISPEYSKCELLIIKAIKNILKKAEDAGTSLFRAGALERVAVVLSTTKGNIESLHKESDLQDDSLYLTSIAKKVADFFSLPSLPYIISNACISGLSALIFAKRLIEYGEYDHVIVVGCDTLSKFITSGFASFKSLSSKRCLPYDAARDGLNLGEACGALLLSSSIESPAILSGGAISNDANHISGPSRTGDGLYLAMKSAIEEGGISKDDISFVNMHGTATLYNDEMESKALTLCGLNHIPVNSLKPYFGHTLGASGVIESIISLHELYSGLFFGTLGFSSLGVPNQMNITSAHREIGMKSFLKSASGFGGCNAAIVVALSDKFPHLSDEKAAERESSFTISPIKRVSIASGELKIDDTVLYSAKTEPFGQFIRALYKLSGHSNMKFYKMDDLSKLGYMAAHFLLQPLMESGSTPLYSPEEIAVVMQNRGASLDSDYKHACLIDEGGAAGASPAVFVYTLANVVLGEICIKNKIKGENTFFIADKYDPELLLRYGRQIIEKNNLKYLILGWCDLVAESYSAHFELFKVER